MADLAEFAAAQIMLGPHKASPAGEDGAAGSAWKPTRTVSDPIEASLVLDHAAALTIEGTYLILNAFVLLQATH